MKNDIKLLYKKDKKLAIKVAKILGYKIKADATIVKTIKNKIKAIERSLDDLAKYINSTQIVMRVDIDRNVRKYKDNLSNLRIVLLSEAERL